MACLLLFVLLISYVTADNATSGRSHEAVASGDVATHASNRGAFKAPFSAGELWNASQNGNKRQRR